MKKFNITLAITVVVAYTLLIISFNMPNQKWFFDLDRINVTVMCGVFVTFYTLPTMVWEHRGIEEEKQISKYYISDDMYRMKEMIRYKAIGGICVSILSIL